MAWYTRQKTRTLSWWFRSALIVKDLVIATAGRRLGLVPKSGGPRQAQSLGGGQGQDITIHGQGQNGHQHGKIAMFLGAARGLVRHYHVVVVLVSRIGYDPHTRSVASVPNKTPDAVFDFLLGTNHQTVEQATNVSLNE